MKMSVLERKNFFTRPLDALIKIWFSKGFLEVLLLPLLLVKNAQWGELIFLMVVYTYLFHLSTGILFKNLNLRRLVEDPQKRLVFHGRRSWSWNQSLFVSVQTRKSILARIVYFLQLFLDLDQRPQVVEVYYLLNCFCRWESFADGGHLLGVASYLLCWRFMQKWHSYLGIYFHKQRQTRADHFWMGFIRV